VSAAVEAPPASDPSSCPACGCHELQPLFETTDRLYRATHERYQIVECWKCRLIRLHPRPTAAGLRRYQRPETWPEGGTPADALERACRCAALRDDLNFVLRALEDAGTPGPVLDLSPGGEPLRRALAAHGLEVLTAAPVEPGNCAAVTMIRLLEHMESPAACLEQAYEQLRADGRIIVQSPNAGCWQFLLFGENWSGLDVPRRLIHFRSRDLESLLESCGFEIVRRKHFSWHNPLRFAASLAPGLEPAVRRARGLAESSWSKLMKNLLYAAMVGLAVPFTLFEDACRAGSTIMVEARKKA
jgi:hypothetical protein